MTAGVTRAIVRSIVTAAATALLLMSANWIEFTTLCPQHRAWIRRQADRSAAIRPEGYMVARPGDVIYACTVQHCFAGSFDCHTDLACYCAPATVGSGTLSGMIGGSCSVDQPHPSREDDQGGCRHSRCDEQLPP